VSLPAEELVVTNGLLEVNWGGAERSLFAAIPPEPDIVVGDFYASVDILDWATDNSEFSYFGFGARFIRLPGGPLHGYGAGLVLRQAGVNQLWISYGDSILDGPSFEMGEHPPPYRLKSCGVGPNFSFRVIDLTTKQLIHAMCATEASRSQGMMGLQFYAPEGLAKSHHITLDNFFATGTKP
jgi:hypothetical protein